MASISRKLRSTVSIVSRTLLTANNTYIYTNYKLHINERSTHKSLTHSKNMRQQHKTPPRAPGSWSSSGHTLTVLSTFFRLPAQTGHFMRTSVRSSSKFVRQQQIHLGSASAPDTKLVSSTQNTSIQVQVPALQVRVQIQYNPGHMYKYKYKYP